MKLLDSYLVVFMERIQLIIKKSDEKTYVKLNKYFDFIKKYVYTYLRRALLWLQYQNR